MSNFRWSQILPLVGVCAATGMLPAPANAQATYYVDFANGDDTASGTQPSAAWKRAPGDPEASGRAAGTRLLPGDRVLFRGGVVYRGSILVNSSGAAGRPIVYSGSDWGGQAIISGTDFFDLKTRPCAEIPSCLREFGTDSNLAVMELPAGIRNSSTLRIGGQEFTQASWPASAFLAGAPQQSGMRVIATSSIRSGSDGRWIVTDPELRRVFGTRTLSGARIAILGAPNTVYYGTVSAFDSAKSEITIQVPNFRISTTSQTFYGLTGHPSLISGPGQAAINSVSGTAYFKGLNSQLSARIELSERNIAFRILRGDHLRFQGFRIQDFSSTSGGGASAFLHTSTPKTGIEILNNVIVGLRGGDSDRAAIALSRVNDLRVHGNIIQDVSPSRGIVVGGSDRASVTGNRFERVLGTNILVIGSRNVRVADNVIVGPFGTHAQGISVYLENVNTVVENNDVINDNLPISIHGPTPGQAPGNLIIRRNFIVASGGGGYALRSWGKGLSGVTIKENLLLGINGAWGATINGADASVVLEHNVATGLGASGGGADASRPRNDWVIRNNTRVGGLLGPQNSALDRQNFSVGLTPRLDLRSELEATIRSTGQIGAQTCQALFSNPMGVRVGARRQC